MSEQDILAMDALDKAADKAGGFVVPPQDKDVHYDYRKLLAYCKEKKLDPLDLTIREMNTFLINRS